MVGSRSRFAATLAGIVVIALLVRVAFVLAYAPARLSIGDGLFYRVQANLFADGHGFIDPFLYAFRGEVQQSAGHPPLFVLALSVVSFFGGTSVLAHQLAEVALATLAVAMIGLVGRAVAGDRVGVIAAFLAAVYPRLWGTLGLVLSESLYAVVVASMLLAAYRFSRHRSSASALVFGLTVGLAALCRGEGVLFLPMLVLPMVVGLRRPRARRLWLLLAAGLGAVVVVGPWTVFNATRFDRPVLISSSVGGVLAGANCDTTFYGTEIGRWDIECASPPVTGDESERSAELGRIAISYALDHVERVPVVVVARVARAFELYRPGPGTLGPAWVRTVLLGTWYGLLPLAIAGAVVLRRRRATLLPLVATIVAVTTSVALSWGSLRFRVPVDMVVVVLAAVALETLLPQRLWRGPRRPPGAATGPLRGEHRRERGHHARHGCSTSRRCAYSVSRLGNDFDRPPQNGFWIVVPPHRGGLVSGYSIR